MNDLSTKKRRVVAVLLAVSLLFSGSAPVFAQSESGARSAGTTVTREGCDIMVTVFLAFAFSDDASWLNAQQLVNRWVGGMLAVWNEPEFTYGFCECPVHFEIVVKSLPQGDKCPEPKNLKTEMPGWHCVQVVSGRERSPQVGWEPVNERGNTADALETPANDGNGYGEWTVWTSGLDAAHEIGHFMGLGDEYHYSDANGDGQGDTYSNDNPQPAGKPQSIMAQTWGQVAALQEHIDEVIENTSVDCPMPECCCANGAFEDYIGEECDPKADPTGCPAGQVCDSTCHCKAGPQVTPICGDGVISQSKEECDPEADPVGCPADEQCMGCKCEKEAEEPLVEEESTGIFVPADRLEFGAEIEERFFEIENRGESPLSWEVAPNLPYWFDIHPMSGEIPAGERSMVQVSVYRGGMAPATYEHEVVILSKEREDNISIIMEVCEGIFTE